jgi:hypothetical protein
MNELTTLIVFLSKTNVEYLTFTDPDCIDDQSVKDGAVIAISIRGSAHLNFDYEGRLVGSSRDCANSHIKRTT